jgi:hypothetical protein
LELYTIQITEITLNFLDFNWQPACADLSPVFQGKEIVLKPPAILRRQCLVADPLAEFSKIFGIGVFDAVKT